MAHSSAGRKLVYDVIVSHILGWHLHTVLDIVFK